MYDYSYSQASINLWPLSLIRIIITILEYSRREYRLAYWVLRQGPL